MENCTLLDSSAWIEYFNEGIASKLCKKELTHAKKVVVPIIVIYEVYKKISSLENENQALIAVGVMRRFHVVELTSEIALAAADLSLAYKLGMADSLILAHAYAESAKLITFDHDFSKIPEITVLKKPVHDPKPEPIKSIPYFSKEALEIGMAASPEDILKFLEGYRELHSKKPACTDDDKKRYADQWFNSQALKQRSKSQTQ